MKKIWIQIFIVIIGILLCVVGHNGVKKYFYKNFFDEKKEIIAYNNYSNISFDLNYIENDTELINENTTTTSTTKPITTTKTTTAKTTSIITTTTIKPDEVFVHEVTKPKVEEDNKKVYENMTLNELIEKLNKNLNSTLSNTGHYFAEYYIKTGLDPYLAIAIVLQETGCKWTCSKLVRECNNIGGMKGNPKCNGGSYKKYNTLEEGINGYLNMLYNNYYSKGLTTPELINPKYATSTSWSVNVNKYIDNIRAS